MNVSDQANIPGRIVGIWEQKSEVATGYRQTTPEIVTMVRVEMADKQVVDVPITNVEAPKGPIAS